MKSLNLRSPLALQTCHPHRHKHRTQDRIANLDDVMQAQTTTQKLPPKDSAYSPWNRRKKRKKNENSKKKRAEGGRERRRSLWTKEGGRKAHHRCPRKRDMVVVDCRLLPRETGNKGRDHYWSVQQTGDVEVVDKWLRKRETGGLIARRGSGGSAGS